MNHRLVVAMLRNAINCEAFDGVLNGQMVLDIDEDAREDEDSDDDE
jgi:hypothetical protein